MLWVHLASACEGGAGSAGHWGALGSVAAGATCVGETFQGASGWDGAGTVEMLAERLGVFVGAQSEVAPDPEVALVQSLASFEGAAGVRSPAGSGSRGAAEVAAGIRFVGAAAVDLGTPAGTGEEHQAVGADIHVGSLVGSGPEAEHQEALWVQAGTPEAAAVPEAEGTAAAASAVGGLQVGPGREGAFLAGA